MSYSEFTVEDFVLNKHFQKWVFSPDAESNLFWQSWLQRHPEKKAVLQEARAILIKLPRVNYGWNSELEEILWESISRETRGVKKAANAKVVPLHATSVLASTTDQSQHRPWNYHKVSRVATTVLLILSLGLAGYLGARKRKKDPPPIAYLTKEALPGTKANFYLPDGTRVDLNAGSTLYYPERFSSQERVVEVQGEAYLEVAKDHTRPFKVKTGVVVTEALGTIFHVRNDQEEVAIALVEGKVQVSIETTDQNKDKLILMPGEQAVLEHEKRLVKDLFDVEKVTAWTRNTILFENAEQQEVVHTLEQWYGVTISTQGQASKPWNFTGKFQDKSLEYVLQSVGYTMDFHFTIEKKDVSIIYP